MNERNLWSAFDRFVANRKLSLFVLLLLATAVRLIGLNRGMWVDELKTWQVVQWSMGDMLANRFMEGHMPFYFIAIRWWMALAGDSDWILRLPSVALGVWSVYLLLRLGEEGFDRRIAWMGALLLSVHGLDLWASQIVRMYALLSFLSIAASLQLLRLERTGRWRHGAALFLAGLIGLTSQALYAFFMVGQIVYLIWNNGRRTLGQWKAFLVLALSAAAVSPVWMILSQRQNQIHGELSTGEVSVERMFRYFLHVLIGDYDQMGLGLFGQALAIAVVVVVVPLLIRLAWKKGLYKRFNSNCDVSPEVCARALSLTRYVVCWVSRYVAVMFVFANFVDNKAGNARYYTSITGGLCLGLAMVIWQIGALRLRGLFTAFLFAVLLLVSGMWLLDKGDGLRLGEEYIEAHRAAGAAVIGCNDVATVNTYRFYAPKAAQEDLTPVSRYMAEYPKEARKTIRALKELRRKTGRLDDALLEKTFGNNREKLEKARYLAPLAEPGEAVDEAFWTNLYKDDGEGWKEFQELRELVRARLAPDRSVWFLFYHEADSALIKMIEGMKDCEITDRRTFKEAQVFRLQLVR